jgi:lipopolysaccharide export system permease protein
MRLPFTLSFYIGRQFLMAILATLLAMMIIIGLIELLELVRRVSNAPRAVPFSIVLQLVVLKLPTSAERIYPFVFMVGSMVALGRLNRNSELVVTRAAGVSVWQFLLPGIFVALALGSVFTTIVNPIAASTIARFDRLEGKYISGQSSLLSVLPSGLWLRQVGEKNIAIEGITAEEYIIHATRIDQATLALETVTIFLFDTDKRFVGRIDTPRATLARGYWSIDAGMISTPTLLPKAVSNYQMPTQLTLSQIQDSFSAPETFSVWQLPAFVAVLEKAGFSALQHKLHFHSLLALPTLLAGMVMLAAVFSLRQPRRGRTGVVVVIGMVSGFLIYFMTNIIYAFGASGGLPIVLAAWAPSLIVLMAASAALLHLEDG